MTNRTTQDQIDGRNFLNSWFFSPPRTRYRATLLGYAGTGKTWLISDWVEELCNPEGQSENFVEPNVCIAAPTHKALDVLRQKCGHLPVAFKTLNSLLGLMISKEEDGSVSKMLNGQDSTFDLLCVDEGSMENQEFFDLIEANTGPNKRFRKVLDIGDPAQLPPVKEEMSPIFKIEDSFTLHEVVRYDNAILNVATMLRKHVTEQTRFTLMDVQLTMQATPEDRSVCIISKGAMYEWSMKAIQKELDCRIIAWTNQAVLHHNGVMHELAFPECPRGDYFAPGEKILLNDSYTLNKAQGSRHLTDKDPPDSLYNGEILTCVEVEEAEECAGVVTKQVRCTRIDGQPLYLRFAPNEDHRARVHKGLNESIYQIDRKLRENPAPADQQLRQELFATRRIINRLAPLRHAYACTVHKSQGSTYDISMVDFGDVYRSDDRARLMYVASTRPSQYLVLAR